MGGRGSSAQRGHIGIKSAASCKDLKELTDYMWNTHRVYYAKSLSGSDFDTIKNIAVNTERLFSEFPALKRLQNSNYQPMIKEVTASGHATGSMYACASYDGTVSINNKYFGSATTLSSHYAKDVKSGYHPSGTTPDDVFVHETGHLMEAALIRINHSSGFGAAWSKCKEATRVVGEACKALKKMPAGKTPAGKALTNDQLVSRVSRYAMKNRSEALAECVADYYRNGANANPLSVQVWNILKRELK